jgi:hypothetical protein
MSTTSMQVTVFRDSYYEVLTQLLVIPTNNMPYFTRSENGTEPFLY